MKEKDRFLPRQAPSADAFFGQPDDCYDLVNQYGTYEIQPTADTENPFPMIAQGLPKAEQARRVGKEEVSAAGERLAAESHEEAGKFQKKFPGGT